MSKKKKDVSKKLMDAFELQNRLTFEYYLNCYEQIMARYPSLAEMNNKQNTNGTEAKYVELWEFLKEKNSRSDESSMEEPARVQAILERKRNLDDAMDDFVGKLDLKLWASYESMSVSL